jgi:hypothetical protein
VRQIAQVFSHQTDAWGGKGLCLISSLYFIAFFTMAKYMWSDPEYKLVGGLLATCALSFVPLGTFGFLKAIDISSHPHLSLF